MHDDTPNDDGTFAALRPRLLRIAHGRVAAAADAEDVVQDAWLRWAEAGPAQPVDPGAWLATVVARLCVDRLRHARVVREALVADYAEIAALLGRGEDACRRLVHRARERLRRRDPAADRRAPAGDAVDRPLRAIRSADHRALVAALIAGDGVRGRDRVHERIRCERLPETGGWVVVLGGVVLATLPPRAVEAVANEAAAID